MREWRRCARVEVGSELVGFHRDRAVVRSDDGRGGVGASSDHRDRCFCGRLQTQSPRRHVKHSQANTTKPADAKPGPNHANRTLSSKPRQPQAEDLLPLLTPSTHGARQNVEMRAEQSMCASARSAERTSYWMVSRRSQTMTQPLPNPTATARLLPHQQTETAAPASAVPGKRMSMFISLATIAQTITLESCANEETDDTPPPRQRV